MPDCKLSTDIMPADCVSLGIGGVSGAAYGIDYEDFKAATVTADADGTISAITLVGTGTKAVKYDLTRGASIPSTPLTVANGGKSGFMHTVGMFLGIKDQATRKEIAGYANFGRMIWIVVLDSAEVSNVYGNDVGLSLTAYDELPNDPAKGGGIDVVWSTPADVTPENLPPVPFFDTDRATTLTALEALLTPVT